MTMPSTILKICLLLTLVVLCYAPPVKENTKEEKEQDGENLEKYMEYHRYFYEVVQALESDPEFKEKLTKATEEDIKSGKIADQLDFVSHHVRTKLDEIKRIELDRLRNLVEKKLELEGKDVNGNVEDPTHKHLDHSNPHTFEIEDLKKLIAKTQEDIDKVDQLRKEQFKEYEMQKEFDKQQKLNSTTGEEKEKLEKEYKELEEKHKKHEKLHEPGHKAQLEEVWQEQDQMQQEFDPKTFFHLHDIDSNGLWDQNEVKALFLKELNKMYNDGAPEDDIREKIEEMEKMRETVFSEVDRNRDGFIDFNEFLAQTKREEFNEDRGWNGLDEQKPYTDEELEEYIARHQQQMMQQHPPQYPGGGVHPGYHPNNVPPQAQFHPGQLPQHPPQQIHYPQGQGHLNTNEVYAQHPNAIPQNYQQQQPNRVHQQQFNQGQQQVNQGQQQFNQGQQQLNQGQQQLNQGQQQPNHQVPHAGANQNYQQQNMNYQQQQNQQNQNNFQNSQSNNNIQQQQNNIPQQQNNVQQQLNNNLNQQQQYQQPNQAGNYQQQTQNNGNQGLRNNPAQGQVQSPVVNQV